MSRVQRSRKAGWRMPPDAVYVGRPSAWGNPYRIGDTYMVAGVGGAFPFPIPTYREPGHYNHSLVVERLTEPEDKIRFFRAYATSSGHPADWLAPLQGKTLVCWCPLDQPCHADVLAELLP